MRNNMYEIGQVLFVVLASKQQIFPMQVVETVTKKTLEGEEVKYCLQAGSDKSTKIMLDQLEGEVFISAEEARSTLVERATSQINALVAAAEKKARVWYSTETEQNKIDTRSFMKQTEELKVSYLDEDDQEESMVVLPDGQVAKIKMPVDKAV